MGKKVSTDNMVGKICRSSPLEALLEKRCSENMQRILNKNTHVKL